MAFSGAASLTVCFATNESGADSADDFIELSSVWNQVLPSEFSPIRTVVGSNQQILVTNLASTTDRFGWTLDENCTTFLQPGNNVSASKTVAFSVTQTPNQTFSLNTLMGTGDYHFCQLPSDNGKWQRVHNQTLHVFGQPTFWPAAGFASIATPLQFMGATDGDVVVMQVASCSDIITNISNTSNHASLGLPTSSHHDALATTAIYNSQIHTDVAMTSLVELNMCFAASESLQPETRISFVQIGRYVQRDIPRFSPVRIMAGSAQHLEISGGGDQELAFWTRTDSCMNTSHASLANSLGGQNYSALLHMSGNESTFVFHTSASSGYWSLCYQVENGIFQNVTRAALQVVEAPTTFPNVGIAGSETFITVLGSTEVCLSHFPS